MEKNNRYAGYENVVKETHKASMALREKVLKETVAKDKYWIKGNWGETLWCLAALYLNEKTDVANDILLKNSKPYIKAMKAKKAETDFLPQKRSDLVPWAYFALTDYTRILCLFRKESPHYPGRLKPETEAAMKEALWCLVKSKSKVEEADLKYILEHHGTENHDLTLRPNYYLAASLFKDDPAFKDRKYDDGHIAQKHYEAYNAYFRAWPRQRARMGLWFEMGSNTYQKYSWPALFNLHELSPDPLVRKQFGMLLDVALVEEAQVSVSGRRGGGRSRASKYKSHSFESYKDLLYGKKGTSGCSHSKVIETSPFKVPAAAILLRKMAFPAAKSFLIIDRVPGELKSERKVIGERDNRNSYVEDSALINYAYRTPSYLIGSTLQNPALSLEKDGKSVLKYSGISRQYRWSGMIFCNDELSAVYPEIEKTHGGRPQHSDWSFQHKNILFVQRITPGKNGMGSYSTGTLSVRFYGKKLKKVEKNGWIFASDGNAFVAVKFLDGDYKWDETKELATPDNDKLDSTSRILIQSGDINADKSFEAFQGAVLSNPLKVEKNRVEYRPEKDQVLECFRYEVKKHKEFKLPRVNGKPINLRPEWTYKSPYLNGMFGEDTVTVTVGPVKKVYDFSEGKSE